MGDFSIADVANWCWVRTYKWSGISIDGLDNLQRWLDAVGAQPGMAAGVAVPFDISSLLDDEKAAEEFAANAQKTLQT